MARSHREELAGGVFHVYARGNNKADIFVDDRDRLTYLTILGATIDRQRWLCLSYCLMPNHVHVLLETPEPNLAAGMQRLHGGYAQSFNRRHNRVGHLFQGRYGAVRITDERQLATTVGYIAVNPVTAGLADVPERWRWGSHRGLSGVESAPAWLAGGRLGELLAGAFGARDAYRVLVAERLAGVAAIASDVSTGAGGGSTVL